ncbi:MAG: hypothetical protein J5707_01355 [Candidatus Methanomethylophilus sp.]|nr:hypothetical protein [Methanomethylophilus sp.]
MLTAGFAGALVMSDDSSAEKTGSGSVTLDSYYVAVEKETDARILFSDTATAYTELTWTAKLTNSEGTAQTSALSKSTGSATDETITVTAPKVAGDYTLEVTFKEKIDSETTNEYTAKTVLHVGSPITLSVKVSNHGNLAFSNNVYFYVDGVKCEDSEQLLTVNPGETKTVEYKYYRHDLSSGAHTYYVSAGDNVDVKGLDAKQTFYYNQASQDILLWIVGGILVLMIVFAVWVFRKPVKNYGKPKARR